MNTEQNIQEKRKNEFNNLLNSVPGYIPLLLFPVRIETHFRHNKVKAVPNENELLKILILYKELLENIKKNITDKAYNLSPHLAKIREAVDTSDFLLDTEIADVFLLNEDIYRKIILPIHYAKYSHYYKEIVNALSNVTTNVKLRNVLISSNGNELKQMDIYSKLTYSKRKSVTSSMRYYSNEPNSSSDSISGKNSDLLFPGAQNLYNFHGAIIYQMLALVEDWVHTIIKSDENKAKSSNNKKNIKNTTQKELCVRIFPDEIFLDYLTDNLTEQEIKDGKFFWLQWFIASGSKRREYEAWQILCSKYPAHRAAWICRKLKPGNIHDFKIGGKLSYRRPYPYLQDIDKSCEDIYKHLSLINIDESETKISTTGEFAFEERIRINIRAIKENLFLIDRDVMFSEYIVDYLYDNIHATVSYLNKRLETFIAFYKKYPGLYGDNNRQMELWDVDYTILKTFKKEVEEFLKKLRAKHISLDDMVQKYLDDNIHDIFPKVSIKRSENPDMPVSHILPDRFMFIGEVKGKKNEKIIHYGKRVKRNLQMGVNINENMDEEPYKITQNGDLEVNGGIAWMVDYDKAEEAGMAITVPIDNSIDEFNYIYILGIKDTSNKDQQHLHDLFNSHNYTTSGLETLKIGTPTNMVEGGKVISATDPETEIKKRYEIEVEETYIGKYHDTFDSKKISDVFGMNYNECWGRITTFDNQELNNAGKAYRALWNHFMRNITSPSPALNFIGEFISRNVKARGVLPAFKIGDQPYGVLPITNFLQLNNNLSKDDGLLMKQLNNLLVSFANHWKEIRNEKVIHSERLKGSQAEKDYLKMAGQTPHSVEFIERTLIDSPLLPQKDIFASNTKKLDIPGQLEPWPIDDIIQNASIDDLIYVVKRVIPDIADEDAGLLVSEFFDLFTYRLDAWFMGVLDYIMHEKNKKHGIKTPKIGAFGWVFNLKENQRVEIGNSKQVIQSMKLSSKSNNDELRIYKNIGQDKGEYIIAPSIQHAITAAILRSGYLRTKKDSNDSHMCINLSSMRVRQALRVLSGVKSGISTATILGADLERYLHDAHKQGTEMDKYIYPLRKIFPQTIDLQSEDKRAGDYVMQVINGEALLNTFINKWDYSESASSWLMKNCMSLDWYKIFNNATKINDNLNHKKSLFKAIERIVDSYDALNDLLLAEGVHRLVQGDIDSYSAIGNFMAEGSGNIPSPAILDTPMEYVVFSNKVGIVLPDCKIPDNKPMCLAEPSVNLWLEQMMGTMDNIWFYIGRTDYSQRTIYSRHTLSELDITPIEYLYLSNYEHSFIQYLETQWRLKNNYFTDKITVHIHEPVCNAENDIYEFKIDDDTNETEKFSLYENELRITQIRSIVLRGSPMNTGDWVASQNNNSDNEKTVNIEDLKSRYTSLRGYYAQLNNEMHLCLRRIETFHVLDDEKLVKMHELLCRCVESGLINSLPQFNKNLFLYRINPTTNQPDYHLNPITYKVEFDLAVEEQYSFVSSFIYAKQQLENRIKEAENIVKSISDEEYHSSQYIEAIQKLLLDSFKVFPKYSLDTVLSKDQKAEYNSIIKSGIHRYENLDRSKFEEWQSDVAEVHEGMELWHRMNMFQSVCNRDSGKTAILQATSNGDVSSLNKWLGCKVDSESELDDVDSLVLFNCEALNQFNIKKNEPAYNSGIIIDSWLEYIPYKKQTAGMVFKCDQPDNEAPQALLLAMHPEFTTIKVGNNWSIDNITELLDSTRFMLMNRAVEPDHIYQDNYLSTLFPLLDSLIRSNTLKFSTVSSAYHSLVTQTYSFTEEETILDFFPGGWLLK